MFAHLDPIALGLQRRQSRTGHLDLRVHHFSRVPQLAVLIGKRFDCLPMPSILALARSQRAEELLPHLDVLQAVSQRRLELDERPPDLEAFFGKLLYLPTGPRAAQKWT